MAPRRADTAAAAAASASAQRQPRRAPSRIVPAVPLALSRAPPAARPITPVESTTETVTQPKPAPEPQPKPVVDTPGEQLNGGPPTPDSRAAGDPGAGHGDGSSEIEPPPKPPGAAAPTPVDDPAQPRATSGPAVNGRQSTPNIPAELPPPFYPSEKPASRTPFEGHEAPFRPPSHMQQSSVEGIVFGGASQDSPAVPSTPHELDPEAAAPQLAHTRPPPGFAPPQFAPPYFPSHSHHPSETAAPWMLPTYSMAPPDAMYPAGPDYPPTFPAGPGPFQAPFQAPFSPRGGPVGLNGNARSHSQSPSKPNSDFEEDPRAMAYQNGNSMPNIEKLEQSPFELASYLSSQFGNPEFADFVLHIRGGEGLMLSVPAHGIVVARSPVIAEAMRRSHPPNFRSKDHRRLADVSILDKFVTPESLNEAIKLLYGAPLLPIQPFLYGLGPFGHETESDSVREDARTRMSQAISYAAAGRALQIPIMQARGLEIAKALLRWDTIDQAIYFALENNSSSLTKTANSLDRNHSDSFEAAFLNDVIDFMAFNFPADFSLHKIAPELHQTPRLPSVVESRPPTHNPRLSKIRFGDAPPEDEVKPNPVAQCLSSVLLSLPLSVVERLFNHHATANQIGWTGAATVMRDLIEEREARRQKSLKSQTRHPHDGMAPRALVENLYREEHMEPSSVHPSGFKLVDRPLGDHSN